MDGVEIFVSDDDLEAILQTLEERDVSYAVTDGAGPHADRSMVSFAIPSHGVESILDDLEDAGLAADDYVVVSDPIFARSATETRLRDRYARTPDRFRTDELHSLVWDMRREPAGFLTLMLLSAGIATAGLLTSTPAIVVGSMVIAPMLTPIVSTSAGIVLGDPALTREGIVSQLVGVGLTILVGALLSVAGIALGLFPRQASVVDLPLVTTRLAPGAMALVVGLLAGAAAAYGLARKEFVLLTGVAIAGALVPSAAAAGLGVAWGNWTLAFGATLLVLLATIAINVGAVGTLWFLEYRPSHASTAPLPSGRRAVLAVGAVALLGVLVLGVGLGTYQYSTLESDVVSESEALLAEEDYEDLQLVEVFAEYPGLATTQEPGTVTVVVSRSDDADHPPVAEPLEERLTERGHDVSVRVQYETYERAG